MSFSACVLLVAAYDNWSEEDLMVIRCKVEISFIYLFPLTVLNSVSTWFNLCGKQQNTFLSCLYFNLNQAPVPTVSQMTSCSVSKSSLIPLIMIGSNAKQVKHVIQTSPGPSWPLSWKYTNFETGYLFSTLNSSLIYQISVCVPVYTIILMKIQINCQQLA